MQAAVGNTAAQSAALSVAHRTTDWLAARRGYVQSALTVLLALAAFFAPEVMAQDIISAKAGIAVGWIKTGVFFVLVVSVLGAGVALAYGKLHWAVFAGVLLGAVVAGLSTDAVIALSGLNGGAPT